MQGSFCLLPALLALFINILLANSAHALSVTYSYEGNYFVEIQDATKVFSTSDKVVGKFTLDCAMVHPADNCKNLRYANYAQLGAVGLDPFGFSAGPAMLPTADGNVDIAQFTFSTDSNAQIVDWNIDLGFPDPSGFINVDTDNEGEGLDSAAALGGGAVIAGQPGTWINDLPPIQPGIDIEVKKSVDNPTPTGPLQTVEFTVEVRNRGAVQAYGVVVEDKLPSGLEIPEGMAAFTSSGYYDASSGRWEVGDIEAGMPAELLKIPAIITTETQPLCVLNAASSYMPGDINTDNNSAFAALRRADIDRCVDLGVRVIDWSIVTSGCLGGYVEYKLEVINTGPDIARHVVLEISETMYETLGFSIQSPDGCEDLSCNWEVLDPGQTLTVVISSRLFTLEESKDHAVKATISSDVQDFRPQNNTVITRHSIGPLPEEPCEKGGEADWDLSGVGGGGCFIATATYGSASHPDVKILREFRDDVLLRTGWGRALIDFYYRHSPDLACYITEHDSARIFSRGILAPVVLVLTYPWQALLVLFAAVVCLVLLWRRAKA